MKKDNKFKISKAELQQIIKEEYANMAKDAERAEEIKARIEAINEELETLPETLDEVEASGTKKVKSTGWTGDGENDVKYGEKFEKIGSHLKEEEEEEGEIEVGGEEIEAPEMDGPEMDGPEVGYFEEKFAELGRELDGKLDGEEIEEIQADPVAPDVSEESVEEVVAEEKHEEGVTEESVNEEEVEEMVNEDLEEPIEGETPAQDQDARFNDYMDKDKHVKEGAESKGTTLLSEGFTPERKTKLDGELNRMKQLAKINK